MIGIAPLASLPWPEDYCWATLLIAERSHSNQASQGHRKNQASQGHRNVQSIPGHVSELSQGQRSLTAETYLITWSFFGST